MKPRLNTFSALLLAASLAACAQGRTPPGTPDVSTGGGSQSMPQPPNSLPPGDAVAAPIEGNVGNVGTTRVGPSTTTARRLTPQQRRARARARVHTEAPNSPTSTTPSGITPPAPTVVPPQ